MESHSKRIDLNLVQNQTEFPLTHPHPPLALSNPPLQLVLPHSNPTLLMERTFPAVFKLVFSN